MNNDHGQYPAPGEVRFVRHLPGPIERVWAFLTESEQRGRWLAAGAMDLRVGGRVELNFRHAELCPASDPVPEKYRELAADGHTVTGHITRCEAPRLLGFTWGDTDGSPSEVTFELTPEANGVRLVLTHRRLGDNRDHQASVSAGWHAHVAILIARLSGTPLPPFWSTHSRLEAEYRRKLGN